MIIKVTTQEKWSPCWQASLKSLTQSVAEASKHRVSQLLLWTSQKASFCHDTRNCGKGRQRSGSLQLFNLQHSLQIVVFSDQKVWWTTMQGTRRSMGLGKSIVHASFTARDRGCGDSKSCIRATTGNTSLLAEGFCEPVPNYVQPMMIMVPFLMLSFKYKDISFICLLITVYS